VAYVLPCSQFGRVRAENSENCGPSDVLQDIFGQFLLICCLIRRKSTSKKNPGKEYIFLLVSTTSSKNVFAIMSIMLNIQKTSKFNQINLSR
jgi:hypothetical protein